MGYLDGYLSLAYFKVASNGDDLLVLDINLPLSSGDNYIFKLLISSFRE